MDLPEVVKRVDSQLVWIHQKLVSDLNLVEVGAREEYLLLKLEIIQKNGTDYYPNVDGAEPELKCSDQYPMWAKQLALKLNTAGICVYLRKFDLATQKLMQVRNMLNQLQGVHRERLFALGSYIIEALEWGMEALKIQDRNEVIEANTDMMRAVDLFQEKWSGLQSSVAVKYLKASLDRSIYTFPDDYELWWLERFLNILTEIIKEDPEYHMWYHYAVETHRELRRLRKKFFSELPLKRPSQEDLDWSKREIELEPDIVISNYDYGILHKDILKSRKRVENERSVYENSMAKLSTALNLSEMASMNHWIWKIRKEKGELLARWSYERKRVDEGLNLLQSCLEHDPTNEYLFHKLARIFHHGVKVESEQGGGRYLKDVKKAELCYKNALEKHSPGIYFQCLRDYLKLAPELALPAQEILRLLEKGIVFLQEQTAVGMKFKLDKTRIWKASLLASENPLEGQANQKRAACEELIAILDNPDLTVKVLMEIFKKPPYAGNANQNSYVDLEEIKKEFEKMRRRRMATEDWTRTIRIEAILFEIDELLQKYAN